jgi:hypothetical protein
MPHHIIRSDEVIAEFDHVDDPDVLERIKSSPALRIALEMTRPQNWWGASLDPNALFAIAKNDGIPVAWVPPATVLVALVAEPDRATRMTVLRAHEQEIIDQCRALVGECRDPEVADKRELVRAAMAAYEDGHREAAMALAVSVGEPLAIWASIPRVQSFESAAELDAWSSAPRRQASISGQSLSSAQSGLTSPSTNSSGRS